MNVKTTIIIAILLLLLGAYAYFFEIKGTEKKQKAEEQKKTLLEVKKEDLSEIRVETGTAKIRLVPEGKDTWSITEPVRAKADEGTVSRIFTAFEKLKYREVIEEQPKDLKQYELDPPQTTFHFAFKKGAAGKSIFVGGKNPVENVYYVKLSGDPKVYLAEGDVGDVASLKLVDFRDKKITDFTSEKVEAVWLKTTSLDLQLKKEGGVWKLTQPLQSPASETQVSSLLSSLEFLRAEDFIDPPLDDAVYGLKEPRASVQLTLEKGLQQKVYFGRKEGDRIYARVEGNPAVASVSDSFSSIFEKPLEDWREKKLAVFNRFDAEEARFKVAGKEYVFRKGKEDKWTQERPVKGEVDGEKIQSLLEKIEVAEIERYGDKPWAEGAPALEVFLTLKDWQEKVTKKHLAFGAIEGNQQMIKNDDYSTIVYTSGALQQQIIKALEEIKPAKK